MSWQLPGSGRGHARSRLAEYACRWPRPVPTARGRSVGRESGIAVRVVHPRIRGAVVGARPDTGRGGPAFELPAAFFPTAGARRLDGPLTARYIDSFVRGQLAAVHALRRAPAFQ